jgi:hypothetical protein
MRPEERATKIRPSYNTAYPRGRVRVGRPKGTGGKRVKEKASLHSPARSLSHRGKKNSLSTIKAIFMS